MSEEEYFELLTEADAHAWRLGPNSSFWSNVSSKQMQLYLQHVYLLCDLREEYGED